MQVEFVPSKHEKAPFLQGFYQLVTYGKPVNIELPQPARIKPAIFGPNHPGW